MASGNLGILVNTNKHKEHVIGITRAASAAGKTVEIFVMDEGIRLLEDAAFSELCDVNGVTISYCDHNASGLGLNKGVVPAKITCASQFNNAQMHSNSDRIIVL